jgi:tripartite-type tricarboxylate transporter receptor subunit TctC
MRLPLLRAAAFVLGMALTGAVPAQTGAEGYPSRTIQLVVPFPAGGFSDVLGRLIAQGLQERIGQPVIVDNRSGASGNLGTDVVAKARPDGYTLLIASLSNVISPNIVSTPFDTLRDFAPISMVASGPPLVMVVNPSSGYQSVKDVIAQAKANPGKLNVATAGAGTSTDLVAQMFKNHASIDVALIPYKGADFNSVVSGETHLNFALVAPALSLIQSGRLKALAVTSDHRVSVLPEVPTMAEAGLEGFEANSFIGVWAPAGTPPAVVDRLHRELSALAKSPEFRERVEKFGMRPEGSSPEAFRTFVRQQIKKWGDVVKGAQSK